MFSTNFLIIIAVLGCIIYLIMQNKRRKKSLKNKENFPILLKSLPFVLYIKDINGNIIFATDKFGEITGISQKEIETKNVKDIYAKKYQDIIQKEDNDIINLNQTIESEKPISLNGTTHWYKIMKSQVCCSADNEKRIAVLFNNIDKDKEIEESKSTFMATLTHDMKTPITAQNNMLNLLYEGAFGPLTSEQKEMIRLTSCSNKYMADIVETILETYKYESGSFELKPEVFDITELINSLCKGAIGLADEKHLKLKFLQSSQECFIFADRFQIKRVIINFLSNAITYGFKNTVIEINLKSFDEFIDLSVKNYSKQIPENDLSTIFSKFKKTKLSNFNKASTGLGLYLSKEIIDMHGGEIYANSFEDGICIFGFKIPVKNKAMVPSEEARV